MTGTLGRTTRTNPHRARQQLIVRALNRSYTIRKTHAVVITPGTELSPVILQLNLREWDEFRATAIRQVFAALEIHRPTPTIDRDRFPRTVDALQAWIEEVYLGMSGR